MYTSQCRKVRELLQESESKDRRVAQLEADVLALSERLERASSDAKRSQEDVNSLRHEMQWKNDRIRYLERLIESKNRPSSPESVNNDESIG